MNLFKPLTLLIIALLITGCDTTEDIFVDDVVDPDGLITEEDALQQNYNLKTPIYKINVTIDEDVDLSSDEVLMKIDEEATDFFNCQFMEGSELGLDEFMIDQGDVVPPLSELRIFVVPFNFECDAVDKNICAGIFFGGSDIIIVAERGFNRCGDLPLLKHEIAHRYGLTPNHSNQDVFEFCSDPEDCGLLDFLDEFNIFG